MSVTSPIDPPRESLPYRPVIVSGAPRTGTHFLHALICTSEAANPFTQEYHYLYFLLDAYLRSLKVFDAARAAGFDSPEAFTRHHFDLMTLSMNQVWCSLGKPANLVMKHCHFTPVLQVMARQFATMKFVVIVRDARDSIASEVRAARKSRNDADLLPLDLIEDSIDRYNLYYMSVVRSAAVLGDRLLSLRYEDLAAGGGIQALRDFLGFDDIAADRLWARSTFDIGGYKHFNMHSNLWGQPVSSRQIGTYRETLPADISARIFERTRKTMLLCEALYPPSSLYASAAGA